MERLALHSWPRLQISAPGVCFCRENMGLATALACTLIIWAIALSRRAPEWETTAHECNYIQCENGPPRWRKKEDVARKVGKHIAYELNPSYQGRLPLQFALDLKKICS